MGGILAESGQLRNWHSLRDKGRARARLEVEPILWNDKNIKKGRRLPPPKLHFMLQLYSFDCIQHGDLLPVAV